MNYPLLSCLSFVVGIVVGLTGIGGASLVTPMLIFVFNVPVSVAISSDVVAVALMKIVGSVKHWRQQTLEPQVVKWLALGSVPGALLGVSLLHFLQQLGIESRDMILLRSVGMIILCVTLMALIRLAISVFLPQMNIPSFPKFDLETNSGRMLTVTIGAILGLLVGMTSVSSGSMFALVLVSCFQLEARKLVGTDITQAAILLGFTALGHLSLGTVDWGLVGAIWLGSLPGVWVGAQLCSFAPQRPLQAIIYSLLMMVSWKLVLV